jgi:UDP-N-acetylmuramoyl-tripeptide--D-alanyl-D-alanine ligase
VERSPIRVTADWVAAAVGGRIVTGDSVQRFTAVGIDTRTLQPGALYIAIRGERFDGADFVNAAVAAGASGVVIPSGRGVRPTGDVVAIEVQDTTAALQALGHAVRRASAAKVVAITGSAGKTTTKEVTAEFLSARYRVMRNRGNLNNHIGLPLSLIELSAAPDVAVVELGMNHAGEISTLVAIAEPDIRVWTNVGEAHLGFFQSVDAIADAKAEIFEGASRDTVLVANADDGRIAARLNAFSGRVVTFGIDNNADVRATKVADRGIDGIGAHVTTAKGAAEIDTPLLGRGNLLNVLAATGVALELGVPLDAIRERAALLRPPSHRGEVVRLRDGITVVDDSYNANPAATKRALDVMANTTAGRRVAILGEMLELGDRSAALHEDVGRAAATVGVDRLLTVGGPPAEALGAAAISAGVPAAHVEHFATSTEAAERASALVRAGDLVLVKGSRGVRTDVVVDRLKSERG